MLFRQFFFIPPPPELLPVLGPLEWYVTPTLIAALLCSSRTGSDLGRMSDGLRSFVNWVSSFPYSGTTIIAGPLSPYKFGSINSPQACFNPLFPTFKHRIYWMKNGRLSKPSHPGWMLDKVIFKCLFTYWLQFSGKNG